MRIIILFIFFFCELTAIHAQSSSPTGRLFEIFTQVVEGDELDYALFKMYNIAPVWYNNLSDRFPLTDDYNYAIACKHNNYNDVEVNYGANDEDYGIFHTITNYGSQPSQSVVFANGHYEFIISHYKGSCLVNTIYFYIDYTTDNYTMGCNNDIWVRYNVSNNTAEVKWNNSGSYYPVTNGSHYTIWDQKNFSRSTTKLELFLSLSSQNNHPYLSWNPTKQNDWTGYKIYRSINMQGGAPGIFSAIATVGKYINEYTDYDLGIGSPWKVYYKVITENNGSEVGLFSNMVEIGAAGFQKRSDLKEVKTISVKVLELHQNFPNPFNPTTVISWQLPIHSHVTLKVYDIIGREIATLINQEKSAGVHEVTFDASRLASGIYFYQLQAGEFQQTKRMILMK